MPFSAQEFHGAFSRGATNVFSMRAECRHDLNKFEVAIIESDYFMFHPKREPLLFDDHRPSGEETIEFFTNATEEQVRNLLRGIPDSHVMIETLRPVTAAENPMERDYNRG